jgi:hypothetical protein
MSNMLSAMEIIASGVSATRIYFGEPPESTQAEIVEGRQHKHRPNWASGAGSLPRARNLLTVRIDNPVRRGQSFNRQYNGVMAY